jgi:e3 binding domain.
MQIQVLRDFAGKLTNERRIYPGVYFLDDEALYGVGQYLIDNGFALELEPPTIDESIPALLPDTADKSIADLITELEARGIDVDSIEGSGARGKLVKADYVAALSNADRAARDVLEFKGRSIELNAPED